MNSEKVRDINEWVSRSFPNNERIEIETISFSLHQPSIVCALLKWLLKVVIGLVAKQIDTLHKKEKFSIKEFFSKCDQIRIFLRIWSHLLKKSLMENFIFFAVTFISMPFIAIFLLLWKESIWKNLWRSVFHLHVYLNIFEISELYVKSFLF